MGAAHGGGGGGGGERRRRGGRGPHIMGPARHGTRAAGATARGGGGTPACATEGKAGPEAEVGDRAWDAVARYG